MNTSNNLIKQYYQLNGKTVTRKELSTFHIALFDALPEENKELQEIWHKIGNALFENPKARVFNLTASGTTTEMLNGVPFMPYNESEDIEQLGKAVTPNDIYDYITKVIINTIQKVGHLPWQREWEKTALFNGKQAVNFDTKKGYRGINYFMLNFEVKYENGEGYLVPRNLDNPYFLTMNSIKKHKGHLKKGSTGNRVVYFTKLYTYSEPEKNGKKLQFSTYDQKKFKTWITKNYNRLQNNGWSIDRLANYYIPILKYYNVFNGADITGIDFKQLPKNTNVDLPVKERIEIAEKIVKNMPNAPKIIFGGDQPAYYPTTDHVQMTPIEAFNNEQSYYSTLFHELIHSTGHKKRLSRFNNSKSTKKEYAFEELIAELGAVFLSAESGILFSTIDNSAKYLRGWNSKLVANMKKDNKFFFRASSKSQASADFILDRDTNGTPKYLKDKSKPKTVVKKLKPTPKPTRRKKAKTEQLALFGALNGTAKNKETIAFNKLILDAKRNGIDTRNVIKLGSTKGILKKYIGNAQMLISGAVIKKSMFKDGDHIAQWYQLINLPDNINNPLAIFKSKGTGFVILTEVKNYKNKPLMVAIHLSKNLRITEVKSIYARKNSKVYNNWKNAKLLIYANKKSSLIKQIFSPMPKEIIKPLINKSTKTESNNQKKDELKGIYMPTIIEVDAEQGTSKHKGANDVPAPQIKGLKSVNNRPKNVVHQYYSITGDVAKLLGKVEIKPKESVAVTLDAPQGAGKTRAFFQFINEFASKGYKVLFVSAEEHPESSLFMDKLDQYIAPGNQHNVFAIDSTNYNEISDLIPQFDIIFVDSWNKILQKNKGIDFDHDLRKKFDSKFFFAIFQRTQNGQMRGGSNAQFDGDIILKIAKEEDFKDNYVIADKNRYQNGDIHEIKYNIYYQKLIDKPTTKEESTTVTNDKIIFLV